MRLDIVGGGMFDDPFFARVLLAGGAAAWVASARLVRVFMAGAVVGVVSGVTRLRRRRCLAAALVGGARGGAIGCAAVVGCCLLAIARVIR